jgi:hypothetical protein
MIGSLPPLTDQKIIEQLTCALTSSTALNEQYRQTIKEQKQLIKELDRFIKDNI